MLLTLLCALTQQTYDTLGRTQTQIFQMGEDKWMKVCAKEQGESTQAMVQAYGSWAEAEQVQTDRLARKMGIASAISGLRKDLFDLLSNVTDTGRALSGGGTMWIQISTSELATTEDTLYALVTRKKATKHWVVSDVTKLLDKLSKRFEENKGYLQPEFGKPATYEEELRLAKAAYKKVVKRASALPRSGSDQVLGICHEVISNVLDLTG